MKRLFVLFFVFVILLSVVSCDSEAFQKKYEVVLVGVERLKLYTYDNIFEEGYGETTLIDKKSGKEYAATYSTRLIYPSCDCDNCADAVERETKVYVKLVSQNKYISLEDHLNGIEPTTKFVETSSPVCYTYDEEERLFFDCFD